MIQISDTVLIMILTGAVLILAGLVIRLEYSMRKFLKGHGAENITDSLKNLDTSVEEFGLFRKELERYLTGVEKRLRKSIQGVHTIRFNPFKGTGSGGNQSFATAFVNEDGDGVVVSSLYSREHVSIFSKPIKNNTSEFELTHEEKTALAEAKKDL